MSNELGLGLLIFGFGMLVGSVVDTLSDFMINENRIDCIIVTDTSKEQKKYLYDLLSQKGISTQYLYRVSTTFKTRK